MLRKAPSATMPAAISLCPTDSRDAASISDEQSAQLRVKILLMAFRNFPSVSPCAISGQRYTEWESQNGFLFVEEQCLQSLVQVTQLLGNGSHYSHIYATAHQCGVDLTGMFHPQECCTHRNVPPTRDRMQPSCGSTRRMRHRTSNITTTCIHVHTCASIKHILAGQVGLGAKEKVVCYVYAYFQIWSNYSSTEQELHTRRDN